MKQGAVGSFEKMLRAACERAEATGENQFIPVPLNRLTEMAEAERRVFVGDAFPWLRKTVRTPSGLRIEVLESYAASKGVAP